MDEATRQHRGTAILDSPPHEPGLLPRWLHEQGAEVILAGGMGQRAQQLFAEKGIRVVYGVPSDTPESVVKAFLDGTITSGENLAITDQLPVRPRASGGDRGLERSFPPSGDGEPSCRGTGLA